MTAVAHAQAHQLVQEGVTAVRVAPEDVNGMPLRLRLDAALDRSQDVLVVIEPSVAVDGEGNPELVSELGAALAGAIAGRVGALVLTGGDTATGVLRGLGCGGLDLVREIEPGVVLSTAAGPHPWPVVTKSGSFGKPGTLVAAVRYLRGLRE
jgi:uncharacterized protein YgbK (DUF1537 family)